MNLNNKHQVARGFTLIELLIVIVVIAILATISIVSYRGIQNRASETILKSDLRGASQQLELHHIDDASYPAGNTPPSNLKPSEGTTFQYSSDGENYCLTATSSRNGVPAYYIQNGSSFAKGVCSGHTDSIGGSGGSTEI